MTSVADGDPTQQTAAHLRERLSEVVSDAIGEPVAGVSELTPLSGGSSRDTWSFDARLPSGMLIPLVLQRQRAKAMYPGLSVGTEARVLQAARDFGAPVANLVSVDESDRLLGAPFLLVERIEGETVPQRILRRPEFAKARERLAYQYGTVLSQLHRIPPETIPGIGFEDPLEQYRTIYDEVASPHPVIELGLRWLSLHRPAPEEHVLVHGDYRNGNGIVNRDGLVAVIDFQLAHAGDPLEDIGWFCSRAWRFGALPQAGGYGSIRQFLDGYLEAGGHPVDIDSLHWWMVLGSLRWAVICLMQGSNYFSGTGRSVELAAVGRRVCEPEFDLLLLLP